ncbi:twin-arginine translocase subunit TatC [Candidatus Electronema sp. TJ]|uniref:twin-arginine translocase subunit TatC n=1 Tax=Candidatus Electronema sp. TJ TaxID=3401573 RepID=UPI003AA8A3C6
MIAFLEQLRPHHEELRRRLLVSALAVAACTGVAWLFIDQIAAFSLRPLLENAQPGKLVYTRLTDAFISYLKLALLCGITVSFPFLLYQAWMFAAPGLLAHEKRLVRRIICWSGGLFLVGAFFAFFIVLPRTLAFFMSYAGENLRPMLKLNLYLAFAARLVLAFAVSFEIPFLMVMAAAAGLVQRSHFQHKRKFFYIAIVVLAFLLAAGDLAATVLLALPLFGLYEAGIIAMKIFVQTQAAAS